MQKKGSPNAALYYDVYHTSLLIRQQI